MHFSGDETGLQWEDRDAEHRGVANGDVERSRRAANVDIGAKCVDLQVGTQVLGLSREKIQHVWALSFCDISGIPSDEFGNLLNVIRDSGAEEHVVSLADWKSLGEPLLKPAQVRLRSATGDDMGVSGSFVVR